MSKQESPDELRTLIEELKNKKQAEGAALKAKVHEAFERVKPINMIKSTLKEASSSKDMGGNIANAALVLVSSYLSKRLFMRLSRSPLKKLAGAVILFGITNYIAKHPDKLKAAGAGILNLVRGKSRKKLH